MASAPATATAPASALARCGGSPLVGKHEEWKFEGESTSPNRVIYVSGSISVGGLSFKCTLLFFTLP